jgi:aryl-alcohol dehydrogenase-like predicted oxidoreductase
LEQRSFGNTGTRLSILGFGGIIVSGIGQPEADNYVSEAIDRGVNYFDVSPNYGNAQERLGPALAGKRDQVFLACKTEKRGRAEAEAELHQSLKILQTDCFDLYQLHAVKTLTEVETIFGPEGAFEVFPKAQHDGKIRHIGCSAHTEEAALALLERFDFASVLFPVNWAAMLTKGFGKAVLEKAEQKGAARLALKALARTDWPEGLQREQRKYPNCWYEPIDEPHLAGLALRFALSQPVTAAIPPGEIRLFRMAVEIAEKFKPITETELAELRELAEANQPLFPRNYK